VGTVNALAISLIVFAVVFGGAFVGIFLRKALPQHHLADDAKDVVRLGTGLIGTIAALVLSLLISSANGSYDTKSGQVKRMTADVILLDRVLDQYGSEAHAVRDLLRRAIDPLVERIWQENRSKAANRSPFSSGIGEDVFAEILALSPKSDVQHALKERAVTVSSDLAQTRLLLFEHTDDSIPVPFLAVLVFWLAIIFASFSLFSRLNPTLIAALFVFALSASGAIFLILELTQPFAGLLQISSAPLRNALAPL
jgi:hypothetical protein